MRAYRESIQELVDGTIGPIRRAELERHLDDCEDCRALVADLQRDPRHRRALDPLEPPDGVWLQIAGRLRQEGRVQAPPPVPAASRAPRARCSRSPRRSCSRSAPRSCCSVPQFRASELGVDPAGRRAPAVRRSAPATRSRKLPSKA